MTDIPNERERRALKHLREQKSLWQLNGVGAKTIRTLCNKGWIEPISPTFPGDERFSITILGLNALIAKEIAGK